MAKDFVVKLDLPEHQEVEASLVDQEHLVALDSEVQQDRMVHQVPLVSRDPLV